MANEKKIQTATFGGGCFWCTEAYFTRLKGVLKVVSGYSGGTKTNPSYQEVCSGLTGHAEVIQITFDPDLISYPQLLDVFFATHDPTTLNRQGADVGTQYRSVILFHDQYQKVEAEKSKQKWQESGEWKDSIVTEITALENFYAAEDYHQDYFQNNPNQPYCQFAITPKLVKFEERFRDLLD